MLTMRSLLGECLFLTVSYCMALFFFIFFFRVEWEEKDFLGRLARREWRWINSNSSTILFQFPKIQKWCIFHNNSMNDSGFASAGRSRCPRKSWVHGRTSKNSWHCSFLCWMMVPPATYPGNSFHSSIQCWVFTFQGLVGFIGPVGEAGLAGEKVRPIKKEIKTNWLIYF